MEESKKFLEDFLNDRLEPFLGEPKNINKKESSNLKLLLFIYFFLVVVLILSFFLSKESKVNVL